MRITRRLSNGLYLKLIGVSLGLVALLIPAKAKAEFGELPPPPGGVETNLMDVFQTVADIMLALIGGVAVIMLIVGGFRYVVSGGDSTAVEGAKNTILYAIIGIVVAFLAYAAVNFLVGRLEA